MKKCNECEQEKTIEDFFRDKRMSDGRMNTCKACRKRYNQTRNKEKKKEWQENNKEKLKESRKEWARKNKEKLQQQKKEWDKENKEKRLEYSRKWRNKNKEHLRKWNNQRRQQPDIKIQTAMSNGIRSAIRELKANRHWEELVGYTLSELMEHLERLFTSEMNWDNYGSYWHIDHIKPQSWFIYDSTESEAFKACWALSNLQPLEASKNCSKGNRYEG